MTNSTDKETFSFQTEVGQLLDIVAGSLYSNREVFLRELVSNASDACDKLRYEVLTNPSLIESEQDFAIEIEINKKAKTISVSDNGIGMSHGELLETLGTIAKSGTGAFLDAIKEGEKGDLGLIGQFGVGFYSSFMVAENVEVLTRRAGETESWVWSSDGKGEFSIEPGDRSYQGTTVTLQLKKDAKEFLEEQRIRTVVQTYSDHISFPVKFGEDTLNSASAIWTRPTKDVTAEQHNDFYRHTAHAFDQPWMTIHNHVEGLVNYTNLLYIPATAPFDLYEPERKSHVKLYVNRVFITENTKGLLPAYLRFLRGIVDSEDLSLNVSREMLQTDPKLTKIRNGLTKRVIGELKKKANKSPVEYGKFWQNFGPVLKEGLVEDTNLRDKILEVCRFNSTNGDELISLADYVGRMKEGQDCIYYIAGEELEKIAKSPHLEGFRAKGVEVLLLADHVDEFWLQHIPQFEEKSFTSITQGDAGLDKIKSDEKDQKNDKDEVPPSQLDSLIASIKLELGEAIKDVRASKRLTDSPVCLIADDGDTDVNLARLLQRHGHLQGDLPRVLELNPGHAMIKKLADRAGEDDAANDSLLKEAAHLLLDQAKISEGEVPADPLEFSRRLTVVMENAF